ncbi:spore germination protein [Paenibacillus sp. HN-1]|uniref:spore germination protein n=1 Tax=Paenibacillus TaxID=44249 RepID=UPI001CA7B88E|nr:MULTISPECIES: spore germination protein [Paenibacillus]MBY9080883.1 spore germination protein [Paenibacillus sp. CGMCC 1.18879]MBY9085125.1 spore germination protein [Paenibacillus sinensis]
MGSWTQQYEAYKKKQSGNQAGLPGLSGPKGDGSHAETQPISPVLQDNLDMLQSLLGDNGDFVIRSFQLFGRHEAALAFYSSIVDKANLLEHLLKPLMRENWPAGQDEDGPSDLMELIWSRVTQLTKASTIKSLPELLTAVSQGCVVLLADTAAEGLAFDLRSIEKRGIEQPQTEQVIRGAREGFIEDLETNLSLLRRRLQTADLKTVINPIGRRTASRVALCYLDGIANPGLIDEVMKRLSDIDIDGVIESGYLEQFMEEYPLSPFPQIQNTERPDKTTSALLEGRAAILVDGSPFALLVPALFNQFFQTVDDYSERFIIAGLIRFIRVAALFFSLFFPSLYVSVISFNPELIPTNFAVAISGGRAGVPFPAVLEVLIMEISMEVLREATIRMPQMVGGALSIVGVLVIGQAAVSAGLSSPITVVIVALTTVGSFATPAYNAAISLRMLRFPLVILAGTFGLYGVMVGTIMIINHLLYLESFGVPYMTPFVFGKWRDFKDTVIRAPLWWIKKRPSFLNPPDMTKLRQGTTKQMWDRIFSQKGEWYESHPAPDHDTPGDERHH